MEQLNARLQSKGLETIKKLTRVGGLPYLECLQNTTERRQGNPGNPSCLVTKR